MLDWADRRPAIAALSVALALYAGGLVWTRLSSAPVLMANLSDDERLSLYGQFSSSAVALLAVALTVLAVLVALPDRPAVEELREGATWSRLQGLLMAVALLCLIALVTAHLGSGIDNGKTGKEWLELIVIATSLTAVLALVVAGAVFALFLQVADEDAPNPSGGRGTARTAIKKKG